MKTPNKIILLLLLVIAVIMLLKWPCNKPVTTPPVVKPIVEQKYTVLIDSIAMVRVTDSMSSIINELDRDILIGNKHYQDLALENWKLEKGMDELLTSIVPDTCKHIVAALTDKFGKLKTASSNKDIEANKRFANLQHVRRNLDGIIKQKDIGYAKLRVSIDTCWAQQKKLEDYAKKIKPKWGIFVGAKLMSDINNLSNFGYGVNLALQNKKGTMFELGITRQNFPVIGNINQIEIGIKKRF